MEELYAAASRNRFKPRAQLFVRSRTREQTSDERTVIQTGATNQDGPSAPFVNRIDGRNRIANIPGGRVFLGGLDNIDNVVRNAAALVRWHFVCADIKSSIDRGRVTADNLAAMSDGELQCESAFSRGGRT
jgi:hypothetical protein